MNKGDIERHVRRWFVMSVLTGRYSGSPESTFDYDIRQVHAQGVESYSQGLINGELSDAFWTASLPQELDTSAASSPYFRLLQAAQVKMNDHGFLSRDISVRDLVAIKSDVHHLFPRDYLKKKGFSKAQYNQIANYVIAQTEINIAIGNKEPKVYFGKLRQQCEGGEKCYGNITRIEDLRENFRMNCIPESVTEMTADDYPAFLAERRKLMAAKLRQYFHSL
jgi:hypothetical protein